MTAPALLVEKQAASLIPHAPFFILGEFLMKQKGGGTSPSRSVQANPISTNEEVGPYLLITSSTTMKSSYLKLDMSVPSK